MLLFRIHESESIYEVFEQKTNFIDIFRVLCEFDQAINIHLEC